MDDKSKKGKENQPLFRRSGFDRRADVDRRQSVNLDVLDSLPRDRRRAERRRRPELRAGWLRVTRWSSVFVGQDVRFRVEVTGTSLPRKADDNLFVV